MLQLIVVILVVTSGCFSEELKAQARDSYLDAYSESHGPAAQNIVNNNNNDRESKYNQFYDNSGPENYGPPHPGYPEPSYPPQNYGPPVYGPPNHIPRYKAFPAPFYGVPHAMMSLFDKFKLKLSIYTILKIILKLVIFKKIVSFIALICLLLFIPKFKMPHEEENDEDDSDSRSFGNDKSHVNARLNMLTQYVLSAIDKYSEGTNSSSRGINKTAEKISRDINNKFSYQSLLNMYTKEDS